MRISDWSSDVCSSDLRMIISFSLALVFFLLLGWLSTQVWFYVDLGVLPQLGRPNDALALILFFLAMPVFTFWATPLASWMRSEEHTSELQSLMRISYAVFCLKTKHI